MSNDCGSAKKQDICVAGVTRDLEAVSREETGAQETGNRGLHRFVANTLCVSRFFSC